MYNYLHRAGEHFVHLHALNSDLITKETIIMPRVSLNTPAPDFELTDFRGQPIRLSDFQGQKHVLLVFNRGFV